MQLKDFIQNPDNPRIISEEELKRLKGKLARVPQGLTAMRIAYVTDMEPGKKTVLVGNTRVKALKEQYGEDGIVPDEYFQDITSMSEAERHEFIVTSNVSDGDWDLKTLLRDYDKEELEDLGLHDALAKLPTTDFDKTDIEFDNFFNNKTKVMCPYCHKENLI